MGSKTLFCFSQAQSKEIAKRMEKGIYRDSIAKQLVLENQRLELVTKKKDQSISKLLTKTWNYENQLLNKDKELLTLQQNINTKDKKVKRGKWHKLVLGAALTAVTGTLVLTNK